MLLLKIVVVSQNFRGKLLPPPHGQKGRHLRGDSLRGEGKQAMPQMVYGAKDGPARGPSVAAVHQGHNRHLYSGQAHPWLHGA